jgi:hypothetical protein
MNEYRTPRIAKLSCSNGLGLRLCAHRDLTFKTTIFFSCTYFVPICR